MFWSICPELPRRNRSSLKRSGVEQCRPALALAPDQPAGQRPERDEADRDQDADELPALLPDEDADHDAAHAGRRQHGADDVDAPRAGVGHVMDALEAAEDDRDHHHLQQEPDSPGEESGQEAAEQRPDRGGDRRRGPNQRVGLLLGPALEVAVDQRLHRRQQQRCAEAADNSPEDDDRRKALGERHGQGAESIAEQAQDEGPLAPRSGRRPCSRSG